MSDLKTDAPVASDKLAALKFLSPMFALIPLKGKAPVGKNWGDTPKGKYAPEDLVKGNYGVVLAETDLVIDVDPRNFQGLLDGKPVPKKTPGCISDRPLSRLFADLGIAIPKTFTVKTGGGGLHLYFTVPAGFACVNDLKDYPGVEFKSLGRQVVGPGSVHPDTGHEYKISPGCPDIRVELPEALIAKIKPAVKSKTLEANAGTGKFIDDIGTRERFASYLKDTAPPSIEGQNGDLNAVKVAMNGRDLGLPPEVTLELMLQVWNPRCQPAWTDDELRTKVANAYRYAAGAVGTGHPEADFTPLPLAPEAPVEEKPGKRKRPVPEDDLPWDLDAQGNVRKSFANILNYLNSPSKKLAQVFGYNEFTARVEFANPAPWHNGIIPRSRVVGDNDLKMLKAYLVTRCHLEATIGLIEEAVVVVAHGNKFHPIREYLSSLTWDGVKRLDGWLHDYCGADDNEYTRAVSRKVLVAAVMRVFKPGIKFDHAVVLEGDQGIGKSGIVRILGSDEWSGDFSIDPHSKDTIQLMQGRWFIELAELEVARRSDGDALKAFVSRQVDTARLAYGRLASEFPRQSVLIATKNPGADGTYLQDDTGNRRWWPVALNPKSGSVDFRGLKDARNQLFAEAMALAKAGESVEMETPGLKKAAEEVVKERHAEHAWFERIASWVESRPPEVAFLTAREIFIDAMGGVDKQLDRRSFGAISGVMRSLRWFKGVQRVGDRPVRGYERPKSK